MKPNCQITILIAIFFTSLNTVYSQQLISGTYAGRWPKKRISAYVFNDTVYLKKWTKKGDTLFHNTPVNSPAKFPMNGIEYNLSFVTNKLPNSLLLISKRDTIELIKLTHMTSNGKVIWATFIIMTYVDNGQPATFINYYYDTSKVETYPNMPDSMTSYINARDDNNYYLKHGLECVYFPLGYFLIKEKRRWRKGVLIKTKTYYYEERSQKFLRYYP
ncbi:MAG: hypothetical protein V4620_08955 [Bacteroidota bacterium]